MFANIWLLASFIHILNIGMEQYSDKDSMNIYNVIYSHQ